jgi:predicted transcriptional regulator of viral defense system
MELLGNGMIRPNRDDISAYRRVLDAARNGDIVKLRNGLYAHPDAIGGSIVDVEAIVPGGVLCLYSAWNLYDLTTQVPDAFYVAVERSRKLNLPTFPNIKPIFQKKELLDLGVTVVKEQGLEVRLTNLERSVCDAVKYRHKIGIDVMTEILDNYLRSPQRNLNTLTEYAKQLRVYSTLFPILQVKL